MVVAALMALAGATSVTAQATIDRLYWKEIRKDARIYVFNDPAEAVRFERSGEIGRAITRPGAGPDGETVVADSETALELFFFKYGIAEYVPRPPVPTMKVEWRDGKTRIATDQAYMEVSNRVQARFLGEIPDDSVQLGGTEYAGHTKGSFRIPRAKSKVEGWIWNSALSYETQLNWPATSSSNPGAILEDAVFDWDVTKTNAIRVRFGQFKVPFGRQQLTSSGNQSFVDRSIVANEFERGRDIGTAVWGTTPGNAFEYRLGVFNGNGMTRTENDNASMQVNGRLMWQPNKNMAMRQRAWVSGPLYSEGDFESADVPIYALAVNYEYASNWGATTANDLKSDVVGLDGILKFKGVFATGEYFFRSRTPETGRPFHSNGWYGQSTYMLPHRRVWEVGARYGEWEQSDLLANDRRSELRGVVSYYYRRHNVKLQTDFGRLETQNGAQKAGSVVNYDVRVQCQFIL
jgi:phosphate-selective porin OprO/OprP